MQAVDTALLSDLKARGLVSQMTAEDALAEHMNSGPVSLYCGFDPTADSLHIGSLVPLLTLARFQQAGHTPIALVGGATGLIGDPSFKAAERKLNTSDTVAQWVDRLKVQLAQFVEFDTEDNAAQIVNNLDWTQDVSVLDFLRDIGKHFSVNNMINKESVKQRLDREGSGISFTEFTYMLLQSFDFAELYRRNRCTMQIGGSDQWGNITGGIDLTRRLHNAQVFGLTLPLVTKADGTKFGKTESGTIWLSPEKTSAYAFYQFWLNTADADVYKFLKYFTFLSVDAIDEIEANDKSSGQKPEAQSILAAEVTKLVHGDSGFVAAKRITDALFRGETANLSESDLEQLKLDGMPFSFLPASTLAASPLTQILSESGMAKSGRLVKDALGRSAVFANGTALSAEDNMRALDVFAKNQAMFGRFFIVKLGKKKNHLFELTA